MAHAEHGSGFDPLKLLEFDDKTGKRATYEAFDFRPRDGEIVVRNKSYGDDASEHEYTVQVVSGIPNRCSCPAWEYHDGACKHMVACALARPVLEAADTGGL